MSVSQKQIWYLPCVQNNDEEISLTFFELPHPSNIENKSPIQIILDNKNNKCYEIKRQQFSKNCRYNENKDLEKYHYSKNKKTGEDIPIKSTILYNINDVSKGEIFCQGTFKYSIKYDITFSLIGAFTKLNKFTEAKTEKQYIDYKHNSQIVAKKEPMFQELDEIHAILTNHHKNWSKIPREMLLQSLKKISDVVVEGGDDYFKITVSKIVEWLSALVDKISNNFPQSLGNEFFSSNKSTMPSDIIKHGKKVHSLNLLISLIPLSIYQVLLDTKSVSESWTLYNDYLSAQELEKRETRALLEKVMHPDVGGCNFNNTYNETNSSKKLLVKRKNSKPSVEKGKGAIDNFFKRK
ncbi:Rnh202p SCDLUD_004589 [Saccharomycodes ludwigii]|uniref:Rnh202p n=1 Tax=Saccharomycodes ludwigii TaxID=36035 RepID=UPI001E8C804F|nr:hypothetical protein SCDLUD_004589 [Saccharomycodes ludwigii]KAH3899160.1 hypothetical protein SCDLUD_004589 [Saccharomycodes ludwigii]